MPSIETKEEKEQRLGSWMYNVIDEFKPLTQEQIVEKLKERANPFAVCVENVLGDFNISTALRNANAFGTQGFYYVGNKKFDRRGALGVWNYTPVNHCPNLDEFVKLKSQYRFVGVDNVPGAVSIGSYQYQPNTMFIFGSEGAGLSNEMLDICDDVIYIEMFGSVRSLNIGVASGIIMNDFVSKINH